MNVTQNDDLIEAKVRLTNAQAEMKEYQLAILQKEYVKREGVSKQWSDQAGRVRAKMLSLPVRLAGMLSGREYLAPEIESITQGLVNEALQDLADEYEAKEEQE